jgi:hypothetical protein
VIVFFAALNRETSGVIPFLFLVAVWFVYHKEMRRRGLWIFGISMIVYLLVFSGLRLFFSKQDLLFPDGQNPGFQLFFFNLGRGISWDRLLVTLSLFPIVAIFIY